MTRSADSARRTPASRSIASGGYRTRNGDLVKFNGVRDLANFLADSEETRSTFVEQLFHYMIKQPIRAYGPETLPKLRELVCRQSSSTSAAWRSIL